MYNRFLRGVILKVLYPLLMLLGLFNKSRKEAYQRFVVSLNNRLLLRSGVKGKRVLLLLPHCLQVDKCDVRITHNIYKCKRCGRCEIKDLIGIAENKNLQLFVATGGNIARKIVADVIPEVVVAVACERDLSSGIADAYPLPVFGISNKRPHGPCVNTSVDLVSVEEAISALTDH